MEFEFGFGRGIEEILRVEGEVTKAGRWIAGVWLGRTMLVFRVC